MAFRENLSLFLTHWGQDGTLAGRPVRGIFDAGAGRMLDGPGVLARELTFQMPSADVPASVTGAQLVLGAATYTVTEHLPDGTGMSLLVLQEAA